MPATSIICTVTEICARLPLIEAVVIADAALHSRRLRLEQLSSWTDSESGRRGIQNVRRMLAHVEPAAESPMESRLRMLLVMAGLPRPRAQVSIHDRWGRFAGRPTSTTKPSVWELSTTAPGIETRWLPTIAARTRLLNAGVRLLRFTASDVLGDPDLVVGQVRDMLTRACP